MSVVAVIPLLIAISIFLGTVTLLIVRRVTRPRISGPSCGNCHYDVRGLFSDICPECGSRLSEVGVLHPDSRRPLGRLGWVIVWTCTLGPIALIANPIILQQIPRKMILQGSRQFSQPASGAYQSITVTGDLTFRVLSQTAPPRNVRATRLLLALDLGNGKSSSMVADFDAMICSFKDSAGKQVQRTLSFAGDEPLQTVLAWYAANQLRVDNPAIPREANEVAAALATHERFRNQTTAGLNPPNYFGGTILPYSTGSFSSNSFDSSKPFRKFTANTGIKWAPDPWPLRLLIAAWIMLWMLGVGVVFFLRRKRISIAQSPYTSPSSNEDALRTNPSSA